jgi:DNA mismatch repair ATPase MutS
MAGTQLSMAIKQWRTAHGPALRDWLNAWAEFEALSALACYAYENPDRTFPEVSEGGPRGTHAPHFEARAAGHPLLPHDGCVPNDVSLNRESRFYVVSGSNMSGKSTLLRTIGLNAVLALAGVPVRAEALRLSRFSVCASLAPADSLLSGRSRFLAEVDRLKQAIGLTGGAQPVLFLIDEIFSGTNSSDRRVAAEAVVRTLVDRGAVGAISTHDLALTEIAAPEGLGGVNVHMGSRPGGGPMDFDYLLKPGVTTEANALAIARMPGVTV